MARALMHNPQMRTFLQEFCSLMGNHFTALADKGDKVKERDASQISETTSSGTCALMWMSIEIVTVRIDPSLVPRLLIEKSLVTTVLIGLQNSTQIEHCLE